jgi:hypothetical protein
LTKQKTQFVGPPACVAHLPLQHSLPPAQARDVARQPPGFLQIPPSHSFEQHCAEVVQREKTGKQSTGAPHTPSSVSCGHPPPQQPPPLHDSPGTLQGRAHTPPRQSPDAHCASLTQVCPAGRGGAAQTPATQASGAQQSWFPSHGVPRGRQVRGAKQVPPWHMPEQQSVPR